MLSSVDLMRETNRLAVLNLVKHGPISRSEIAEQSGLSSTSVTNITAELIDAGLIAETGTVGARRGRPRVTLEVVSDARYVIGIKVMPDVLVGVLTDLDASVIAEHRRSVRAVSGDGPTVASLVEDIADLVAEILDGLPGAGDRLLGIGLGLAGVIDADRGICRYSPFFDWHDVDLVSPVRIATGFDVYLENDVNSLTLAEKWYGHGIGRTNFAVMTVGRGVGVGLVINDQFYSGHGGVGEIGHIQVQPDGPVCTCERRGCLEALASDAAVVRSVEHAMADGIPTTVPADDISIETIAEAAAEGDDTAIAALREAGRWLAVGLTTLVNLVNPELVVVAGEGIAAGGDRLAPLSAALRDLRFDSRGPEVELAVEHAGDRVWARGAACVVLSEFFRSPRPWRTRAAASA